MGYRYPQPDNEDAFEQLCLRLYRKLWRNESLKLYGKRGERQDGIDIIDPLCVKPVRAVQCKHHEPTKTLAPSEIETEVQKAEQSLHRIEHFVIATTAKKSRNAQDAVARLNQRTHKKFDVDIHFWEDMCEHASAMGRLVAELIVYGDNILAGAVANSQLTATVSYSDDSPSFAASPLSEIEALFNDGQLEVARHELETRAAP